MEGAIMSYKKLRFGITAAGLTCLLAGYVVAQQATQTREEISTSDQSDRAGAQNERLQQRPSGTVQRNQLQTRQSTQLNRRDVQAGGQNQEVERFLASCLLAKNKGEIELSKFAQQQAESPQIKELAQQMVQDHQQLVEQLEQVAGHQGQPGQNDVQRQTSETTRLPGSPGASQTETRTTRSLTATGGSQDSGAIQQLIQIEQQIVERQGQSAREMLQQKQGSEFDNAFLGMTIHAHANTLAALEVIQQQGGQLAQVAQQASPVVQQHLDHAKQLKEQQQRAGQPGARAERTTPRTQRQ
jgi:predicted outer membrane protein